MTANGHDEPDDDMPQGKLEPATAGGAAPRMARYGEGPEGRPARRERDLPEHRGGEGFFGRAGKFLRDVRAELGRVTWPNAIQVRNTTIITVIAVLFFALYLFVIDRLFTFVLDQFHKLVGA
jgi:preprotein translocase subunit SecE